MGWEIDPTIEVRESDFLLIFTNVKKRELSGLIKEQEILDCGSEIGVVFQRH